MKQVVFCSAIAATALVILGHIWAATPPTPDALPDPIPANNNTGRSAQGTIHFSLGLKWNETSRHFSVPFANDTDRSIKILGIQTSPRLYLTNFPKSVSSHSTTDLTAFFIDEAGGSNGSDTIKVLTSTGPRTIVIDQDREQVVSFDETSVGWKQGDPTSSKTVTLTVKDGRTNPVAAKVVGTTVSATLKNLGSGKWSVSVTPSTTKTAQRFPVVIEFNPAVPGVTGVINCEITAVDL